MGPLLSFFAGISVTVGPFCFVSGTVAVGLILFVLCCLFLCFLIGTVAVGLVLFVVLCFCIFYIVVFNYFFLKYIYCKVGLFCFCVCFRY